MISSFIKSFLSVFIVCGFLFLVFLYHNELYSLVDETLFPKEQIIIKEANQYARSYTYEVYQMTDDFSPDNKTELLNIFYTILNSGWDTFFFYCPSEYDHCLSDVNNVVSDENVLSSINNYISPYNSYSTIAVSLDSYGKVIITPVYTYSQEMIDTINLKVEEITKNIITSKMTTREKIRIFHDYVVNTSRYDSVMYNTGVNKYRANTAYGPLIYGHAICGGYSDAMALFLDSLDIPNYKIASTNHVWNYVEVNNNWYHLDLTWDDPITSSGMDRLIYTYFLISTEQLEKLNTSGNHTYNKNLY